MNITAKAKQSRMKKTHDRQHQTDVKRIHTQTVSELKGKRTGFHSQCPHCGCLVNVSEHLC